MLTFSINTTANQAYFTNETEVPSDNFAHVEKVTIRRVHIGSIIKRKVKESGMKVKVLVEKMRFGSANMLYDDYKKRDLNTDLLARFSEKLGHNFFLEYLTDEEKHKLAHPGEPYVNQKEAAECRKRVDQLKDELLDSRLEVIKLKTEVDVLREQIRKMES